MDTDDSGTSSTYTRQGQYSSVLHQPVFDKLEGCKRILIAGCGGGYDFFAGIPLFFALRKAGAECVLANLAFTGDHDLAAEKVSDMCWKITADSSRTTQDWSFENTKYWPELKVSHWLKKKLGLDIPVYMFSHDIGVVPLHAAYKAIIEKEKIDAVLLVDGGTDSLMFGNEQDVGTPTEDMTSICAVNMIKNVKAKILFNIGFGVDCFHGVCHSSYLENVCTIGQAGGFYGTFSLLHTHEEAKRFQEIFEASNPENSIVCSSVLSAVQSQFGDKHSKHTASRTRGSKLYISPLMSMYWAYDLGIVASHILYLDTLVDTQTSRQVGQKIDTFRSKFFSMRKYIGTRPDTKIEY